MTKVDCSCIQCGKSFQTTEYRVNSGRGKFCSRACSDANKIGKSNWTGKKHSVESRLKMSQAHKGIISGMSGKAHSLESRKKMSDALKGKEPWIKGKTHSPETRLKLSKSLSGKTAWNKGIPMNPHAKEKMRKALTGRVSAKKGLKTGKPAWNRGLHPSSETLKKLSDSHKGQDHWTGRKHSKESLEKMSSTHKLNPTRAWLGKKRPEIAERSRQTLYKLYSSGAFPKQTNTSIERLMKQELLLRGFQEGVDFIHQYHLQGKFHLDFFFPNKKLVVECDGDYWHAIPKKYSGKVLTKAQLRTQKIDKSKYAYISKLDDGTWKVLRFWESDLNKDIKACVDKVEAALNEATRILKKKGAIIISFPLRYNNEILSESHIIQDKNFEVAQWGKELLRDKVEKMETLCAPEDYFIYGRLK